MRAVWLLVLWGMAASCFGQLSSEVPLRVTESLQVQLTINDRPYWFTLDSGCWACVIDPRVAAQISCRHKKTDSPGQLGDKIATIPRLQVGSATLTNVAMFETRRVSDVGETLPDTSERVAGNLGYNALRLLSIGVDFVNRRAWIWPAGMSHEARAIFFASQKSQLLSRVKVDSHSLVTCDFTFAGRTKRAYLDLGAFTCVLPESWARRERKHIRIRPKTTYGVNGPFAFGGKHAAVLDRLQISDFTWTDAPVWLTEPGDDHPMVGFTVLSSLGRVLFDFSGGAVYCPAAKKRFGLLDTMLSSLGASVHGGNLSLNGHETFPVNSVKLLFDQRLDAQKDLSARIATSAQCKDLLDQLLGAQIPTLWTAEPDDKLVNVRNSEYVFSDGWVCPLKVPLPKPSKEANPFQVPGYYLIWNGHSTRLPQGRLVVPSSHPQVIAVGDVPPLPAPNARGNSWFYRIPELSIDTYDWDDLGWSLITGPRVITPDGTVTRPSKEKTPGSAIAGQDYKTKP